MRSTAFCSTMLLDAISIYMNHHESMGWLKGQFSGQPHLVGGLEHVFFSHILGIIIPIDKYFSEGGPNHQPAIY